jgi:hypothetical protein
MTSYQYAELSKSEYITQIVKSMIDKVIYQQENAQAQLDFTQMFKPVCRQKPKVEKIEDTKPKPVINTTDVLQKKVFDVKRWFCTSRPQYAKSCGISSLVSSWNFLFSTLGYGSFPVLTQEEACKILGYEGNLDSIRFDYFATNPMLVKWWYAICRHYNLKGRASMFYKPQGIMMNSQVTDKIALKKLIDGLNDKRKAFIYHCWGHYFQIVGYEIASKNPLKAYSSYNLEEDEIWFIICDTYGPECPLISRKWCDIIKDMTIKFPSYIDIRHLERGERTWDNQGLVNPHGILVVECTNCKENIL